MKILHICTFSTWGAGRAARRLHEGLLAAGHESAMFVLVPRPDASDEVVLGPASGFGETARQAFERARVFAERRLSTRRPTLVPGFSDDRAPLWPRFLRRLPAADFYHFHWVGGFLDHRRCLPLLTSRAPLVWTLHDTNPFTGGCHYDLGCGRFTQRCGRCPMLGARRERDYSRRVWERKHSAYATIAPHRMMVVAPSRWLAREANRSTLMGRFEATVIPNGVDATVFSPIGRAAARRILGIPDDANVVAFVAANIEDPVKGLATLLAALERVRSRLDIRLLTAGYREHPIPCPVPWLHLGSLENDRLLALLYSAADALVVPSLQEVLASTLLEAMSCGVPVIGSAIGGIPDVIVPGLNGLLVPPGDAAALADAITEMFADRAAMQRQGREARRTIEGRFTFQSQTRSYLEVYRKLSEQRGPTAPLQQESA